MMRSRKLYIGRWAQGPPSLWISLDQEPSAVHSLPVPCLAVVILYYLRSLLSKGGFLCTASFPAGTPLPAPPEHTIYNGALAITMVVACARFHYKTIASVKKKKKNMVMIWLYRFKLKPPLKLFSSQKGCHCQIFW
jgi:hypothetical protein